MLREAMFMIGILYNSESCHGMTLKHIKEFAMIEKNLLRFLLSAPASESGAKPKNFVISNQRVNYIKVIHMREDHKLLKRVFKAQKKNPLKGDWTELVKIDMQNCDINEEYFKTFCNV